MVDCLVSLSQEGVCLEMSAWSEVDKAAIFQLLVDNTSPAMYVWKERWDFLD